MLNAICKGFEELQLLGLVDKKRDFKITATTSWMCSIVDAFKKRVMRLLQWKFRIQLQKA